VTPCNDVVEYQRFEASCCLHRQGEVTGNGHLSLKQSSVMSGDMFRLHVPFNFRLAKLVIRNSVEKTHLTHVTIFSV
jgi:hypothetical protein